jgi:hypothetical protein
MLSSLACMFTHQRTGDVDGFSAEFPAQVEDAGDSFSHLKLNTLSFLHNSFSLQLCIYQSNLLTLLHTGDSFSHLKFNTLSFLHNSFSLQLCINQSNGGCFHQDNQKCGRSLKLKAGREAGNKKKFLLKQSCRILKHGPRSNKKIKKQ